MKAGFSLDNDKNNHSCRIFWMVIEIIKKVCFDILDYHLNRQRYSSFLSGKTRVQRGRPCPCTIKVQGS